MVKRILVCGLSTNLGGIESYILTLYRAINKEILQFDFLFGHEVGIIPFEDEIVSFGGRVYREGYSIWERMSGKGPSLNVFFERHQDLDGVYLNQCAIEGSYCLLMKAAERNLTYRIFHMHNNAYTNKTCTAKPKNRVWELYYSFTNKNVVTDRLACSQMAGDWKFGTGNFTVIPNAVEFDRFAFSSDIRLKMRRKYRIADESPVIGFCGRICYEKKPEFVIDIFCQLLKVNPKVRLLMVGTGDKYDEIYKIIECRNISEKVIMTGMIKNVSDYYQMMDCLLLPSKAEGFGIVLLEAQASGLNCFTTKKYVPEETNVTERVHFIDREASAKKWAEEILSIGFDRKDCIDILKRSSYSVDNMVNEFMRIIHKPNRGGNT